jgi:hypothetical protein
MAYSSTILFSICTIVTKQNEYNNMKTSFEQKGFTNDCEYLWVDNTKENVYDAYQAIKYFLNTANGKYVLIVHQDVLCSDEKVKLINILNDLEAKDSSWAIVGNAGARGYHQAILHINTAGQIETTENLPCLVQSLDENFLLIKASARLTISNDITGFHLYGTDLCIIANFLGYTCYVIPFMVKHLSTGNLTDLAKYVNPFVTKYAKKFQGRFVQTTCTRFYLSNSALKNKLYNSSFIFFFIKAWQRFKYNKELASQGNKYKTNRTKEKN